MNPFEFFIPQNITVGAGTLAKLPECALYAPSYGNGVSG